MAEGYHAFELSDLEALENSERRFPVLPERRKNDLYELDDIDFKYRYRLNKSTVEEIVQILHTKLQSNTARNMAITPEEKVLTALRYYATGIQHVNVGDLVKMSQPSANRCINEMSRCLAELGSQFISLPGTEEERLSISQEFFEKFGFPPVYGALDCTLIKILNPGGPNAETFRSRKKFFALNVQTMCDANMTIRNVVARWPGSTHDSTVFDHSYLRAHLETQVPSRYHVLGDSGYPLRSYLMTPFLHPITAAQRRYNTSHIRARNVVERQYGLWKKRFSCIEGVLRCNLQNAQAIIVATAVLHNIAIKCNDEFDFDEEDTDEDDTSLSPNNNAQHSGIAKRNVIVSNFFSA